MVARFRAATVCDKGRTAIESKLQPSSWSCCHLLISFFLAPLQHSCGFSGNFQIEIYMHLASVICFCCFNWLAQSCRFFFSSSMADVALWLGPYMSISSKNVICTKTQKVRKCRQITTNRKSPSQICVSSKKNSKPDTQKGQEPKQKHPQRGFAKGHSGLTTASRSKTCRNELSTTKFSETWKSKHRAYLS